MKIGFVVFAIQRVQVRQGLAVLTQPIPRLDRLEERIQVIRLCQQRLLRGGQLIGITLWAPEGGAAA